MDKYANIFNISFAQEFAYKANFIMWRVRNVLAFLLIFFLWDTVFADSQRILFGYDRDSIMTYIFGILLVKAIVLSARTVDVSGEISNGDIVNLLLKPVDYFRYWLVRDFASKALNLSFAIFEVAILYVIFKPVFYFQTDPGILLAFVLTIIFAVLIFFTTLFIVSSVTFWAPEISWGAQFLVTVVITEFLSGAIFPLDIFPATVQQVLSFTPFPYMIFFPLQVYLGKVSGLALFKGLIVSGVWAFVLYFLMRFIWNKGLRVFQAYGR